MSFTHSCRKKYKMTQYNMNSVTDVHLLKLPKQFGQELCRMFVNEIQLNIFGMQ